MNNIIYSIYQVIIYPIELLLEITFSVLYEMRHDVGLSIIGVSLVVNILMLPLYNRAEKISNEERRLHDMMKGDISHIKHTFRGDERFMMLQTYYRKRNYHPLLSLRSSLPLLMQVPFFLAAYHFLSHLSLLNNMSFLWIKNLNSPDGIIVIPAVGIDILPQMILLQGFKINVLPILMTLINFLSTWIYAKRLSAKEKMQLYVMACIFLVLLYNSPSGLVLYWTMNNIFSLIKNIVSAFCKRFSLKKNISKPEYSSKTNVSREVTQLFILGIILLTILLGVTIPSSVVVSSPGEFVTVAAYTNPLQYVFHSMLISAGFFLLWLPIFYYIGSNAAKKCICCLLWIYSGVALIDFLFFGKVDIYINSKLKYDTEPVFSELKIVLNLVLVIITASIMLYVFVKRKLFAKTMYGVLIASTILLAISNIIYTEIKLTDMPYLKNNAQRYEGFTLSKHGKNVVVIMLDREIGSFFPYILAEKPELKEKYSGFVYYPNTISFGDRTLTGAPALFGGYEYTPEGMAERPEEKLVDKHDEALKIMPVLFSENGYKTTVYDAPLARYKWISDLSIYDDYPEVHAYSLKGQFSDKELIRDVDKYRYRSFFMYSIYKSVPLLFQSGVYGNGKYHFPDHRSHLNSEFTDHYSILQNMNNLTLVEDSDQNTFMMMDNEIAHWEAELQLPDYVPTAIVNNRGLETGYRTDEKGNSFEIDIFCTYHVNIAAIIELGKWLDYLKENDVYDNTRIIIVSDHGYNLGQFENLIQDDGRDMEKVVPILLFKDFNSKEYTESDEFMTNADTPILAMNGLISHPKNPFTQKEINDAEKHSHDQMVLISDTDGDDPQHNKDRYSFDIPDQMWYSVHDNVYDKSNWNQMPEGRKSIK